MIERIRTLAVRINNTIGNPITLLMAIGSVLIAYVFLPIQGAAKWNLTTGLTFNTASSSIELITGVAAVVAATLIGKQQKAHREETRQLHADHQEQLGKMHRIIADLHYEVAQYVHPDSPDDRREPSEGDHDNARQS